MVAAEEHYCDNLKRVCLVIYCRCPGKQESQQGFQFVPVPEGSITKVWQDLHLIMVKSWDGRKTLDIL